MIPVYKIELSKAQLASLKADERSLLILSGHALNQISTLLKLVTFSSSRVPSHPVEAMVSAAQSHTMLRLLVGVLGETLVWLNRADNQRLIGQVYLPLMNASSQDRYNTVKKHFGGSSLLKTVRNRFSFHYPSPEDMEAAFEYTPPDEDWSLYMSEAVSNSMWLSSELVMGFGMIGASGIDDPIEGFKQIMAEAMLVANAAGNFLIEMMKTMLRKHFGPAALRHELAMEVTDAPSSRSFWIPFYVELFGSDHPNQAVDQPPGSGVGR